MSDVSYKNWYSMSDKALAERIGAFVKYHRLEQSKPLFFDLIFVWNKTKRRTCWQMPQALVALH